MRLSQFEYEKRKTGKLMVNIIESQNNVQEIIKTRII